jgi:hypothetical protein
MRAPRPGTVSLTSLLAAAVAVLVAAVAGVGVALAAGSSANPTFEVRVQTLHNGTFRDAGDYATQFGPADAGQGTWQTYESSTGAEDLGFIQVGGTSAGTVEVHLDALAAGGATDIGDYPTAFPIADASKGTFELVGSSSGAPELGLIKTADTQSKDVNVVLEALSNGSYKSAGDYHSDFPSTDAGDGTWQLIATSGAPELALIGSSSGTVTVRLDALSGGSYQRVANYPSKLSHPGSGVWQLFGSSGGAPELGYAQLTPGPIQVRWATLSGGSYQSAGSDASNFASSLASDGSWQLFGPGPAPVLALVKTPVAAPTTTTTVTVPVTVTTVETEPLPTPPPPKPHRRAHVRAQLVISYRYHLTRTRLVRLKISRFPRRARIEVRCYGRGCPRLAVAAGYKRLGGALHSLDGRLLAAGQLLKITVTAPGLLPESIGVRIRDGKKPLARLL